MCGFSRTWDGQFALALQEGGISFDKLVSLNIANGYTRHFAEVVVRVGKNGLFGAYEETAQLA